VRTGAIVVLVVLAAAIALTVAAVAMPQSRQRLPKLAGLGAGGILAAYLVARGVIEFFVINYSSPASYRNDWGGPSLAGVFAVHSGPGLAVLVAAAGYLLRRRRAGNRGPRPAGTRTTTESKPLATAGGPHD
jgi:hypothetical protein